jgi:putative phosphoesterase
LGSQSPTRLNDSRFKSEAYRKRENGIRLNNFKQYPFVKILVMGDTHIPERADAIPLPLLEFIETECPEAILFTGDATDESVLMLLERFAPVYAVRGNMDKNALPLLLSLNLGKKIMLVHGHQFGRGNYSALSEYSRGHEILVCGHTHVQEHFEQGGILIVNPGSATGAETGGRKFPKTFTLLSKSVEEYTIDSDGVHKNSYKSGQ